MYACVYVWGEFHMMCGVDTSLCVSCRLFGVQRQFCGIRSLPPPLRRFWEGTQAARLACEAPSPAEHFTSPTFVDFSHVTPHCGDPKVYVEITGYRTGKRWAESTPQKGGSGFGTHCSFRPFSRIFYRLSWFFCSGLLFVCLSEAPYVSRTITNHYPHFSANPLCFRLCFPEHPLLFC